MLERVAGHKPLFKSSEQWPETQVPPRQSRSNLHAAPSGGRGEQCPSRQLPPEHCESTAHDSGYGVEHCPALQLPAAQYESEEHVVFGAESGGFAGVVAQPTAAASNTPHATSFRIRRSSGHDDVEGVLASRVGRD